jgi:hypothetical protein
MVAQANLAIQVQAELQALQEQVVQTVQVVTQVIVVQAVHQVLQVQVVHQALQE